MKLIKYLHEALINAHQNGAACYAAITFSSVWGFAFYSQIDHLLPNNVFIKILISLLLPVIIVKIWIYFSEKSKYWMSKVNSLRVQKTKLESEISSLSTSYEEFQKLKAADFKNLLDRVGACNSKEKELIADWLRKNP